MAKDAFGEIFKVLKKGPLPSDEVLEKIPSFMFCRYLGGNSITIMPANEFNKYHKEIPVPIQYKLIKQVFAGKGIFPKMLKKLPKEDKYDNLCKYYKCNREIAKLYSTFLSKQEIDDINKLYEIKGLP